MLQNNKQKTKTQVINKMQKIESKYISCSAFAKMLHIQLIDKYIL